MADKSDGKGVCQISTLALEAECKTSFLGIPFYLAAGKGKLLAGTSIWPPANPMDVFWTVLPLFCYANIVLFVPLFALKNHQFACHATDVSHVMLVAGTGGALPRPLR